MLSATIPGNKIIPEDSILSREYFGQELTHITFAQNLLGLTSSMSPSSQPQQGLGVIYP